jgi:hypothetical protein
MGCKKRVGMNFSAHIVGMNFNCHKYGMTFKTDVLAPEEMVLGIEDGNLGYKDEEENDYGFIGLERR